MPRDPHPRCREAARAIEKKLGFRIEFRNNENVCSLIVPLGPTNYRHINPNDAVKLWDALLERECHVAEMAEALAEIVGSQTCAYVSVHTDRARREALAKAESLLAKLKEGSNG